MRPFRGVRFLFVLVAVAGLVLGGCGDDSADVESAGSDTTTSSEKAAVASVTTPGEERSGQTFTKEQSGETAQVKVGETVTVDLETCPGCGYHWEVTSPTDEEIVKFLGSKQDEREAPKEGEPVIVGGSVMEHFTFEAVAAGTTSVTLGYLPPAEEEAEEEFTLEFVVR
jgi:predicted secreted protein